MKPIIAPSILAADWGNLHDQVESVAKAGADWLHLDVMDGHFVPPITFGPQLVSAIRKRSPLTLDVHLMIEKPENQIENFAKAGADFITVHVEASRHLHRVVQGIHELGKKAGVALNPATPLVTLEPIIEELDMILLMTVNPGWGGQKFIESSVARIKAVAEMISQTRRDVLLEVDGGITDKTAQLAVASGASVLVAGTYVFGQPDFKPPIALLKSAGQGF